MKMLQFYKTLRALPRTVWLIGLISLINDSASEMLYPILPLYLTTVLMAGPKVIGLIEGIAESTSALLNAPVAQYYYLSSGSLGAILRGKPNHLK